MRVKEIKLDKSTLRALWRSTAATVLSCFGEAEDLLMDEPASALDPIATMKIKS